MLRFFEKTDLLPALLKVMITALPSRSEAGDAIQGPRPWWGRTSRNQCDGRDFKAWLPRLAPGLAGHGKLRTAAALAEQATLTRASGCKITHLHHNLYGTIFRQDTFRENLFGRTICYTFSTFALQSSWY